jgi:hypothetical protein
LHHDDGSIGGVFTVISDAIQRFVGRRRRVTAPDQDWTARTGSRATAAPEHPDVTTEREAALARLTGRLSQAGSLREVIVAALERVARTVGPVRPAAIGGTGTTALDSGAGDAAGGLRGPV